MQSGRSRRFIFCISGIYFTQSKAFVRSTDARTTYSFSRRRSVSFCCSSKTTRAAVVEPDGRKAYWSRIFSAIELTQKGRVNKSTDHQSLKDPGEYGDH